MPMSKQKGEEPMIKLRRLASLVVCGSLAWTVPVAADAVADWNATAVAAVTLGRPGGPGALDMALVQAAVHDAVEPSRDGSNLIMSRFQEPRVPQLRP